VNPWPFDDRSADVLGSAKLNGLVNPEAYLSHVSARIAVLPTIPS
jgi:hypothetical protein